MSHRKYEAPRHGSLGFLPRKRTKHPHGRIRSFPKDDPTKPCHLTAFMGFKAGMTHVVRDLVRPGSKLHNKEVVEAVTLVEAPPIVCVGIVGYVETPQGIKVLTTVWAQHLGVAFLRRFYKSWTHERHKHFTATALKWADDSKEKCIDREIARMKKYCTVIRLICHTQPTLVPVQRKKAVVKEIQVNGGTIEEKVDFAYGKLEKKITVKDVFEENEMIDVIGVTKGKGMEGTVTRWGVTRLPRKTHKGLRKVACIGAWHPANVQFSVARAGQRGYHHRTMIGKKIFKIGNGSDPKSATTSFDLTEKPITPMGGFSNYGDIREDFIMLKGSIPGPSRRIVTLRKPVFARRSRRATEQVELKFIDTASKVGRGRFQTTLEKRRVMGPTKKWAAH